MSRSSTRPARLATIGLLAAASLFMAGCSTVATKGVASPTSSATPTADLRPWASAMAEQSTQLEQMKSKLADQDCDAVGSNEPLCGAQFTVATIEAQTIAIEVGGVSIAAAKSYLGTPPGEIAELYASTKSAAYTASRDGRAWSRDCIGSDSEACLVKAEAFTNDLDDLSTQFSAWGPYS